MKRIILAFALVLASSLAMAAQSRPVVITWTASTSASVTGYAIYSCTVPSGGTSCTPSTSGTPLATVTTTTFAISEPISTTYGYSVVAQAPACTPTTPLTTPCGSAPPVTVTAVPVPPQVAGASNVVVVVP